MPPITAEALTLFLVVYARATAIFCGPFSLPDLERLVVLLSKGSTELFNFIGLPQHVNSEEQDGHARTHARECSKINLNSSLSAIEKAM